MPPIYTELYDVVESGGVRIVYNEIQRQFSMPFLCKSITDQYIRYTYPYGVFYRLQDIDKEIKKRRIKGLIHYVQAFCFRRIEDKVFRHCLKVPILTIEGDMPEPMDARTKLRIEAFIEMFERKDATRISCLS